MPLLTELRKMHQAGLRRMRRWLDILRGPVRVGEIPPLSPFPEIARLQKTTLLQELTAEDLFDQISTPDVRGRILQILDHLGGSELPDQAYRSGLRDTTWDQRSAAHVVLTWYAWRFRPKRFLTTGPVDNVALAAVGLTSPNTAMVLLIDERTSRARANHRRLERISREIARSGYKSRIRLVSARQFPRLLVENQSVDLVLFNGSRSLKGREPFAESILRHCAPGGLIVCPGVSASDSWEKKGFRFLEGPKSSGLVLAFKVKDSGTCSRGEAA